MGKTITVIVLVLAVGTSRSWATEPGAGSPSGKSPPPQRELSPELAAIRAGSQTFADAFNKHNAKAIASLWTEHGEYIDETGRRFAGRAAIEKVYAQFFVENPKAKIHVVIDSLRRVSRAVVVEDGRALSDSAPAGVSRYTAVHVKTGDKWLLASVRDTWIEAPPATQSAADLNWLIGTWVAEERGVQTESVCRWVVEGRFIERRYTTTSLDGTKTAGVQLVGWNPVGGHVQSWDFSPDGGHAIGIWFAIDDGWRAQVTGTTGGGILTSAVYLLKRLDDNAYVWQSVQRSLGDTTLPDTDEVIIRRKPAK